MISRRLSAPRRVISHYDEALLELSTAERESYARTLDLDSLGDLGRLKHQPTIFTVSPLQVRHEHLLHQSPPDMWGIFASHVTAIDGIDDETRAGLKWDKGRLSDDCRDLIPLNVVGNIVSIIIQLANCTSDTVFFSPPDDWQRWVTSAALRLVATRAKDLARMAAAMGSAQSTEIDTGESTDETSTQSPSVSH